MTDERLKLHVVKIKANGGQTVIVGNLNELQEKYVLAVRRVEEERDKGGLISEEAWNTMQKLGATLSFLEKQSTSQ